MLDVFAGTGAFGLEALSRGAAHVTFIELNRAALDVLRANIAACHAQDRSTVLASMPGHASRRAHGVVFLDPPYRQDLVPRALARLRDERRLAPDALLIAETARDEPPPATACSPTASMVPRASASGGRSEQL